MQFPNFSALFFSVFAITVYAVLAGNEPNAAPAFEPNERILFQGDSITEMNRGRSADPNHILGHSYAFLIAARYGCDYPQRHLTFINRGVGGNKVSDLAKLWKVDTLDLKPDIQHSHRRERSERRRERGTI